MWHKLPLPTTFLLRWKFRAFNLYARNPDRKGRRQDPVEERNAVLERYREECQNAVKNADRLRVFNVRTVSMGNTGDWTASPYWQSPEKLFPTGPRFLDCLFDGVLTLLG